MTEKGNDKQTGAPDRVARAVMADLHREGDPARARAVQRYFSDAIVALGVGVPAVRGVVRERMKPLKGVWTPADVIRCCDLLLREPEMEVRMAGVLVLASFKKALAPGLTDHAYPWLRQRLDNWALVDLFSGAVMSPLLERYPAVGAAPASPLQAWSRDACLWVRRAALVTLVPFARRGQLLDLVYRLADEHLADREPLMHKALGWLLREAGRTDAERLRAYLLRHGPAVPRTALRYAIEHFSKADRVEMMSATRGRRDGVRSRERERGV